LIVTRLAAAATLLMMVLQLDRADTWPVVPCAPLGAEIFFVPILLLIPSYPMVVVLVRHRSAGLAVVVGVLTGVLTLAAIIVAIARPTGVFTYRDLLEWSVFAVVQCILVISAARAARATVGPGQYGALIFSSCRIVALYMLVVLVFYALWPARLESGNSGSEARAIGTMRAIRSAQEAYQSLHPERGYASTFEELAVAKAIAPGMTQDATWYRYVMAAGRRDASGSVTGFEAWATFSEPHGFCRSFFTDESRTIRFTHDARRATAADPPLE